MRSTGKADHAALGVITGITSTAYAATAQNPHPFQAMSVLQCLDCGSTVFAQVRGMC
jgi:hypothetical protein